MDFLTFLLSSTVNALVFLLSFGSLGFATLHNATEILPGCRASLTCQALCPALCGAEEVIRRKPVLTCFNIIQFIVTSEEI